MRSREELTSVGPPFWPTLLEWIEASPRSVQVLPPPSGDRGHCLRYLQVTTRSPLGAMAWNTGGLLLDDGWIRLLGGGTDGLPDIATASSMVDPAARPVAPDLVVIGHDVLGGVFALNGGALPTALHTVSYFAPNSLEWEECGGLAYGEFVHWALTGNVEPFYEGFRWPGWRQEVAALPPDRGIHFIPQPFTQQFHDDISAAQRSVVPVAELFDSYQSAAEQLSEVGPGQPFRYVVDNVPGSGPADPGPNRVDQ